MWGAGCWSVLDAVGIQGNLMPGHVGKRLSGRSKDKTKAKGISNEEAEVTCISHSSGGGGGLWPCLGFGCFQAGPKLVAILLSQVLGL